MRLKPIISDINQILVDAGFIFNPELDEFVCHSNPSFRLDLGGYRGKLACLDIYHVTMDDNRFDPKTVIDEFYLLISDRVSLIPWKHNEPEWPAMAWNKAAWA